MLGSSSFSSSSKDCDRRYYTKNYRYGSSANEIYFLISLSEFIWLELLNILYLFLVYFGNFCYPR